MIEHCVICNERVEHNRWKTTEGGWMCGRHYNTPKSLDSKIADMSPEEVLSGAQYGVKENWGKPKSKRDWGKEHKQQTEFLKGALK